MSKPETKPDNVVPFPNGWDSPGWADAAREYHKQRGNRSSVVELNPETIKRIRGYLDPKVSIDDAYNRMNSLEVHGLAQSTIDAAEYLNKQNNPEELRQWLARHSAEERAALKEYFENKGKR